MRKQKNNIKHCSHAPKTDGWTDGRTDGRTDNIKATPERKTVHVFVYPDI